MRDFFENPAAGAGRTRALSPLAEAANEAVLATSEAADLAFYLTDAQAGVIGQRGLLTVWTCGNGGAAEGHDGDDGRCSAIACQHQATALTGRLIGAEQPENALGATVLAALQRVNPWAWAGVVLCLSDFATPRYRQRLGTRLVDGDDGPPPEVG